MSLLENMITPERLNRALGYGTYGLISYQFLQTALFGSHITSKHPWLSSLFPYTVDDSTATGNTYWNWQSDHPLFNNVLLLALFGAQHSLQARIWVQMGLKRHLAPWMERLLYVSGSAIAFSLIMSFWQPMTYPVIWDFRGTALESGLNGLYYAGLAWILITLGYSAMHDLFDFRKSFGENVTELSVPHYLPPVYRAHRSPLFTGLLLCFWASPIMTIGHFLFASLMTLYTVSAIQFQEKDKLIRLGAQYAEYQRRVPLFLPSIQALFNEDDSITLPGAVQEKLDEKLKAGDRPSVVSPIDVHRYQHVGSR